MATTFGLAQEGDTLVFEKLINNWEQFHNKAAYSEAVDQARLAVDLAEKKGNRYWLAIALNREGRSLMKIKSRIKRNRRTATERFEQSLLYLAGVDDSDLRIDNLKQLKWLATKANDQQQIALYKKQIEGVKNLSQTNNQNEILADRVDSLALQEELLSRQVDSLSEVQLKSKLLIALQKNQVDSFSFKQTRDSFLLAQKQFLLEQQSITMDLQSSKISLQKSQRNFLLTLAGLITLLAIGFVLRYKQSQNHNKLLEAKNKIIVAEKKRSDELLLNILPAVVAMELKETGVAKAKKYDQATVLFTDFQDFSIIAKSLSPEQLVFELDFHFKAFDDIIGKYKLEKIKTIGDAYMCVGGLPEERMGNAKTVIEAALEIQDFLSDLKIERKKSNKSFFEARIGIHTGPLVAGVVGSKKFAYDIWGDTVNVASRLEAKGEVGKVNISSATYSLVEKEFQFENRGKLPIKNLGEVGMYFVSRP